MRRAVGIFFFLGLALLGGLSLWVDDEMSVFRRGGSYYFVDLPSAAGLEAGSAVRVAGIRAGRIVSLDLGKDGVRVHFMLRERFRLREDSQASLPATSLLASGRTLSLTLGSPGARELPVRKSRPGVEVKNVSPVTGLDTLIRKADGLFGNLEQAGPAIKEAAESIRNLAVKIEKGEGTLGKLVSDPALYDEMKSAASHLARVCRKIDEGEGTLARLINDGALYEEAARFLKEAREAVEDAREQAPITAFSSVIFAAFQ